ncbi:MAG: hypothetical protein IPK92_22180 [Nitrospira sp.]|nr:hypothetical protein [Nitrospira sp.]
MYEEPYRWVEAVGNRRQYLDEQFAQGSPVVGVVCDQGILLMTMSKGTPKLYEIYDRLAFGEWDTRPILRSCGSRCWRWLTLKGSTALRPMSRESSRQVRHRTGRQTGV